MPAIDPSSWRGALMTRVRRANCGDLRQTRECLSGLWAKGIFLATSLQRVEKAD